MSRLGLVQTASELMDNLSDDSYGGAGSGSAGIPTNNLPPEPVHRPLDDSPVDTTIIVDEPVDGGPMQVPVPAVSDASNMWGYIPIALAGIVAYAAMSDTTIDRVGSVKRNKLLPALAIGGLGLYFLFRKPTPAAAAAAAAAANSNTNTGTSTGTGTSSITHSDAGNAVIQSLSSAYPALSSVLSRMTDDELSAVSRYLVFYRKGPGTPVSLVSLIQSIQSKYNITL